MSYVPIQIMELGAICTALIEGGKETSPLKIVHIRILFKLSELGSIPDAREGLRVEYLAANVALERSSVSRELSRMLKMGYIDLAPPGLRTSGYRLTLVGQRELDRLGIAMKRVERVIRSGLLVKDFEILKAHLGKIVALMPREYTEDISKLTLLREKKQQRSKRKLGP